MKLWAGQNRTFQTQLSTPAAPRTNGIAERAGLCAPLMRLLDVQRSVMVGHPFDRGTLGVSLFLSSATARAPPTKGVRARPARLGGVWGGEHTTFFVLRFWNNYKHLQGGVAKRKRGGTQGWYMSKINSLLGVVHKPACRRYQWLTHAAVQPRAKRASPPDKTMKSLINRSGEAV